MPSMKSTRADRGFVSASRIGVVSCASTNADAPVSATGKHWPRSRTRTPRTNQRRARGAERRSARRVRAAAASALATLAQAISSRRGAQQHREHAVALLPQASAIERSVGTVRDAFSTTC